MRERFQQLGELKVTKECINVSFWRKLIFSQDVKVTYDLTSGIPKYAKVTFANEADFKAALARQQISFLGRVLDLKKSIHASNLRRLVPTPSY